MEIVKREVQIFNDPLSHSIDGFDTLVEMGFKEVRDGTGDHRGTSWDYENDLFIISVDAWLNVSLSQKGVNHGLGTDPIKIQVDDKFDLEMLMEFIDAHKD